MVVVYGTVCLDRIRRVPCLPDKGRYVEIEQEDEALGGEAANTCAVLRAWRSDCRLAGNSLGQGEPARLVENKLLEAGLDDACLPQGSEHPAPYCDIYVTPDGERTMFGKGFLEMEERHGLDVIPWDNADWLALDDNHGKAARTALLAARERGVKVYAMDFVRDDDPIGPDVVWQSSTDWTGTKGDPAASWAWLRAWQKKHGCPAILTEGAHGLWAALPGRKPAFFRSFPCPKPLDSTGAGDCFRAGMLHGLDKGWEFGECLAFASAAGAMACTRYGGAANAPSLESVLELRDVHPDIAAEFREAAG